MGQTTRSRPYSSRKAFFFLAARRWALSRFPRSFAILAVLGKENRRSLDVAVVVSLVLETTRVSHFCLRCLCFNGRCVGKALRRAKKPRREEDNTYEVKNRVSDFTKLVQNHLKWLSPSFFSFLSKKAEEKGFFWTRQVPSWFSICDIALLAMTWPATVAPSKNESHGWYISNPARGCGLDRANPDRGGLVAARSTPNPRAWIALPTWNCNLHGWLIWILQGSSDAHQETVRIDSRGFPSFSILSG